MREVLFRGRGKDGVWQYGSLHIEYGETDREGNRCLDFRVLGMRGECHYVLPETVGQYIGLIDKNGRKVFEGDILKSHWDEDYPEDFCYEVVLWYDNGWCIKQGTATPDRLDGVFKDDCLWCSEVVGNVYDNPELLEVEM